MKLLIRATNWVGDAVMCIPALEAIRVHWPDAEISILARPWVADLYRDQPFANKLISLDASVRSPFAMDNISRELGREHFDCALLLQNAFSAAWLAWRAGIPERIGYASDARRLLLTRAVRVPRNGEIPAHESYYYLELLRRIGWLDKLPTITKIVLRLAPGASEAAESRLRKTGVHPGSLRIALAPGAAYGAAKCWLPERFAAVADSLVDEFNADVILFGTTSEVEVSRQIAARMRHQPISLVGETHIGELPAFFSRSQLFIGNDSGAMHVAAAVGVPVVGVFGSTDPHGTAPVTPRRTLVQRKVACSPCFLRECPIDHRCMTRVTVADVHAAALKWLEQLPRA